MNILVIGEEVNFNECSSRLGAEHTYAWEVEPEDISQKIDDNFLIFDFTIDKNLSRFEKYQQRRSAIVFANTSNVTLKRLSGNQSVQCNLFGFCGLPTLLNRSLLEVSLLKKEDEPALKEICLMLNADYRVVEDQIGLVTPRIVCMIINEAFYALEEGVASVDDIDRAMKSGTNYPYGPFEWCKKIGIKNVYNLLHAVYSETKDDRYKISALLATHAAQSKSL